jgi:hypothetical protein
MSVAAPAAPASHIAPGAPARGGRGWWWTAAGVLAVFVALGLLSEAFAPEPQGPAGSSYATSAPGAGAWAQLLSRDGRSVVRLRRSLSGARLPAGQTLVVLNAGTLSPAGARTVRRFVAHGGRAVFGGVAPGVLSTLLAHPPASRAAPIRTGHRAATLPETDGVSSVRSAGLGAFAGPGPGATAAITGSGGTLLAVDRLGRGRIDMLADASTVENVLLADADDARLALNLAGPAGTTVVFAEALHGYTPASGLAAFPGRWWVAIAGLALAAGAWAMSRGRRLGPPESSGPAPVPPRAAYVEAMARAIAGRDGHEADTDGGAG